MLRFLLLDATDVTPDILMHLSLKDLCFLASTCSTLKNCTYLPCIELQFWRKMIHNAMVFATFNRRMAMRTCSPSGHPWPFVSIAELSRQLDDTGLSRWYKLTRINFCYDFMFVDPDCRDWVCAFGVPDPRDHMAKALGVDFRRFYDENGAFRAVSY